MTVRTCKYEDILAVSELEKASFKGEGYSYKQLAASFENPSCYMFVAEDGGEVMGYGCITVACEDADLENVVVAEAYRKSGVGKAIVEELLNTAKAKLAQKVFLEVRVSNSAALQLYLSCGFTGVYARTRYYSDGEDCLVMSRKL